MMRHTDSTTHLNSRLGIRHVIIFVTFAFSAVTVSAQSEPSKTFRFDFHGFVNPHFYADSRQVVGGREEMMLFFPKPEILSETTSGYDVNDGWNMNLLSITARLNLAVHGPDLLGAHTMAFIEGDFTGSTNASNNDLRLRHAYLQLDWGHSRLLAGQYWHPMVVHEIMPNTRPLNMGAPFHPYARYNQLRYFGHLNKFEAIAVALFQQDNMSQGFIDDAVTSSTHFQRRSAIPELHIQLRYNGERLLAGAAANMLTMQPHIYTRPSNTVFCDNQFEWNPVDRKTFSSFSYSVFLKYRWKEWALSFQTLLNNSLYEICSMGGYLAVIHHLESSIGPSCIAVDYRPWHFNTAWLDFGRTTGLWRPGIFLGYGRNMESLDYTHDSSLNPEYIFLGRGRDIEYLWRIQPRIGWHPSSVFSLYSEAEYTYAQYHASGGVGNLRLMLSAEYRW
ncbi:MAG: hypothetical protein K5842_04530 [Bacteroidales bacterium]|nr:hypothetical protein [Bacteroidales bacterium]